MRLPPRLIGAALITFGSLMAAPAFAGDKIKADGFQYSDEVTVEGIKNGQLAVRVKGNDKLFELSKVESIYLDGQPNFNKAEDSRKDAKASSALYKTAINNINDKKLRTLAELRSVEPLDLDGKYTDAVANFLNVYAVSPTDSVWKLRPTHVPAEGSTMLKDAAGKIEAKVASFTAADAKKNLETWQVELLTKAKDPKAAVLAAKLSGVPSDAPPAANTAAPAAAAAPKVDVQAVISGQGLEAVSNAISAKQYDQAIALADKSLPTAVGASAIQLFNLKAMAYENKGGDEDLALAAATLLRIPAHYPSSTEAPNAILHAAELQKRLKHTDEAKRLYQEVVDSYPTSAAAVKAKPQL